MTWWHYLLLVNFYLILFFGFYALLLRKETFFQLNRVYLVAATVLSFLIPLIQSDWVSNLFITQQVQRTVYGGSLYISPEFSVTAQNTGVTFGAIVNAIYIAVTSFLIVRLAWQLLVLKKAIERPSPSAAYSFFKKISLGENVSQSSVIAQHEAVHAGQWHSVDVMIIETVMIINWFNPVVYLYRFAIKYIHEFIADQQVIERGTDKVDYALLLLSQTFETDTHNLVIPFYNHSLLKQRIKMLQKNKSNRIMLAKYGLSAPLFMLMMILSSATVNNSKAIKTISKHTEKVLQTPVDVEITINGEIPVDKKDVNTQSSPVNTTGGNTVIKVKADTVLDNRVFSKVDIMPEFPGGLQAFGQFLADNVKYPEIDKTNRVEGRVFASFIVEKDGGLSDVKALRGPSETLKQAAVDALLKSPKWTPGVQNGHVVRVSFTVPVSFTLPPADEQVYKKVSGRMPEFPGGLAAFGKFLSEKIKYPKEDRENGVSGRVFCSFVVEKDGTLSDIKAVKGPSATMNAEAVRVLMLSPKWTPGTDEKGEAVRTSYTVPISFTLEEQYDGKDKTENIGILKLRDGTAPPLYVIDGVKYLPGKAMPKISPDAISAISVLKDETAKAIYGDAGKNGVIIITTKKKK